MNKNVLDNICFYDVETTGIPSKGLNGIEF